MILKPYSTAAAFLDATRTAMETDEAANGLMYGLALRAQQFPERITIPHYYAGVFDGGALQAAALMTPPHNLVVMAARPASAAEAFDKLARDLQANGWQVPGVLGPSQAALAFADAWQALTGELYRLNMHERVYRLTQVIPPPQPPGRMRLALEADVDLAGRWLWEFHVEALPDEPITHEDTLETARVKIADQDFYLWQAGEQVVALAGRTRPTPHGYCVGPVYTPLAFRRKGYATALTAALSQSLLDAGKQFVALFTNLANPTSNSIYMKIGYQPVTDFDLYVFRK